MEPYDGRPRKLSSTSPWVYVGCGCAAIVILAMAGIAGMSWWGYKSVKRFEEASKNPDAAAAQIREVLPYDELPAGYYPVGSFSIPFLMDMVILGDRKPVEGQEASPERNIEERGLIYMSIRNLQGNKDDMRRYLRGEAPEPGKESNWRSNVNFDAEELIRRGTIQVNGREVLYAAHRGEVNQDGRDVEGLVTMFMPECPGDSRLRFGLWFGPDPEPAKPVAEVDFTGTTADPEKLAEFAGYFRFCG
ncbi:hypothetical protein EHM82_03260 [bacterium]|nr:MAG: hypothetical protein EHM82_03260 [bacterium]